MLGSLQSLQELLAAIAYPTYSRVFAWGINDAGSKVSPSLCFILGSEASFCSHSVEKCLSWLDVWVYHSDTHHVQRRLSWVYGFTILTPSLFSNRDLHVLGYAIVNLKYEKNFVTVHTTNCAQSDLIKAVFSMVRERLGAA